MTQRDLRGMRIRWPYNSAAHWCGLLGGLGLGLLLLVPLVQLGALANGRIGWVGLVGALLVLAGSVVARRGQPGNRIGAEPSAAPDRSGTSSARGS
jgi:hypothetical protein